LYFIEPSQTESNTVFEVVRNSSLFIFIVAAKTLFSNGKEVNLKDACDGENNKKLLPTMVVRAKSSFARSLQVNKLKNM
jgi:hypothetical protein